ncbi:MAG TPA: hypothetical protein VG389_22765 [Myxococcota bacterium]|jgi:hypothetical protein|nr:hypothetical protein [Myxococcota bacterium]
MRRGFLVMGVCLALALWAGRPSQAWAGDAAGATAPWPPGSYVYGGPHPMPDGLGADYCYAATAHVHPFPPADPALYNWVGDALFFIGDPLAFGWDPAVAALYGYFGPHPIDLAYGAGYCHFPGFHHHHWVPNHPELGDWWDDGGTWTWRGGFGPMYWSYASFYARYYAGTYRPRYGAVPSGGARPPGAGVMYAPTHPYAPGSPRYAATSGKGGGAGYYSATPARPLTGKSVAAPKTAPARPTFSAAPVRTVPPALRPGLGKH